MQKKQRIRSIPSPYTRGGRFGKKVGGGIKESRLKREQGRNAAVRAVNDVHF